MNSFYFKEFLSVWTNGAYYVNVCESFNYKSVYCHSLNAVETMDQRTGTPPSLQVAANQVVQTPLALKQMPTKRDANKGLKTLLKESW